MDSLKLLSAREALLRLLDGLQYKPRTERVELSEALGRVLGVDVVSPIDLPPFDRSAVDGYAVKAQDTFGAGEEKPLRLKLALRVPVGRPPPGAIKPGECAYVATGSMMPEGSNAVVMVEYTKELGEWVEVRRPVAPGENVVKRGSEAVRGSRLLSKGVKLTPRLLGLLASVGLREVEVVAKPRVAVISTGAELTEPGRELREGMVYDVNSVTLSAMAEEAGCEVIKMGIVEDELGRLTGAIKQAVLTSDLVLVSGGTSKGEGDLLPRALSSVPGARVLFHGLALRPGKPTIAALINGKPLVGLPGNPTSAMAVFHVLVRPLIIKMTGAVKEEGAAVEARMGVRAYSAKGRRELLFVKLAREEGGLKAYPMPTGPEAASTYATADGYVDVPEEVEILEEGELVKVYLLS
ncbi:MAG: molybdopterin-binding protein [Candidatus Nezhaarchaeota archaeon]|nr:molybdopterin-binding protein [Candidatus Nezhaarchaeota archaeon]